jgi:glucosamine 6-phosphate synthetase-like amidotransferase/phosphosugar isomerase protein
MAELEFGGMKFRGNKLITVLTALSMLGGAAWGGFEFYNDYRNMKAKIDKYVTPDLSGINERISVMEEQVVQAVDYTRDIKVDLKKDILTIEQQSDRVEKIVKQTQDDIDKALREVEIVSRESEKDVRDTMRETEKRIDEEMDTLEKKLKVQIQEALDNPLARGTN